MGNKVKPTTSDQNSDQLNQLSEAYQSLFQKYQTLNNQLIKIQFEQINTLRYITGKLLEINSNDETIQTQIKTLVKQLNTVEQQKDAQQTN
ncbi:MAG: hypothetical protein R2685_10820 [Candidatus Nitrosocosmicus sp.]|nr:hypothetical protein [Candidatus Nitrosocosmicus sp.]